MGKRKYGYAFAVALLMASPLSAQQRRVALPSPVLYMYGYTDVLTAGHAGFAGNAWASKESPAAYDKVLFKSLWQQTLDTFTVISGVTQDAAMVQGLRDHGKVFAYCVSNGIDKKHKTVEDFVKAWSEPFENTLGGRLPGGFDAICIDEFHSDADGSSQAQMAIQALRLVREKYPDRLIFASGVYKLGDGGPDSRSADKKKTYDDTLRAIQKYADVFLLENYQRTGNPQLYYIPAMAKNIDSRCPGLLKKTIYILYIAQDKTFRADDNPSVDFFGFLEKQINLIKAGPLTRTMPGIGYWIFYRANPETIKEVIRLTTEHYR